MRSGGETGIRSPWRGNSKSQQARATDARKNVGWLGDLLEDGRLFAEDDRYDSGLMITGPVPSLQRGGAGLYEVRSNPVDERKIVLGTMTSEARGLGLLE